MSEIDLDRALLRGVMEGNIDAQKWLVDKCYEPLSRMLASNFDANRTYGFSDIIQSTFCHFFEDIRLGKVVLENPHEVLALVLRFAKNRCLDNLRREKVRAEHAPRVFAEKFGNHVDESPEADIILRETYDKLVSHLNPRMRRIFNLEKEGLSNQQIAEVIGDGATSESVRKSVERAKKLLRQRKHD